MTRVWGVFSVLLVIAAGWSGYQGSYTSLGICLALSMVCAIICDLLKRQTMRQGRDDVWERRDAEGLKPIWPAEVGSYE